MISLERYLDKKNFHFKLPLSNFQKIQLFLDVHILKKIPFNKKTFISSKRNISLYFEILLDFIKKEFGVQEKSFLIHFNNKYFGKYFSLDLNTENKKIKGSGVHLDDLEIALSKSIGEFLERYFTFEVLPDEKNYITYKTKEYFSNSENVWVRDFHDFSKMQYEKYFERFSLKDNVEIAMLQVENIVKKKKLFYPVQQIFWGQYELRKSEGLQSGITTSGCAGGFTYEDAVISAIYENIERDSFFCFWLTKSRPIEIVVDSADMEVFRKFSSLIENTNFELYVFDITTDLEIPSCVCLLRDSVSGGLCVSGSSRLNMYEAVQTALLELSLGFGILSLGEESKIELKDYQPFRTSGIGRSERLGYWATKKSFDSISFLFSGAKKKLSEYQKLSFLKKKEELEFVLKIFQVKGNGYDSVYVHSVQNKILKKIGYFVVRVIIPKLYPLYLIEHFAFTESKRLREFNFWKNGREKFEINTEPHPFP